VLQWARFDSVWPIGRNVDNGEREKEEEKRENAIDDAW